MTRNRFNQTNRSTGRWYHQTTNNLTLSKARGLFLEVNDNINMKDTYKITNVHTPTDEKEKMLLIKSIVTIIYYRLIIRLTS